MAHTKAGKTTKGNRNSIAKRLGIKIYGGEQVATGNIILRQRGSRYHSGEGTKIGRDYTIFAIKNGTVRFKINRGNQIVHVEG